MPVLENARHEKFAQEIAKGQSNREAYKAAGYETKNIAAADASASRLLSDAKIKGRINELQTRGAERAEVTVASLIEELEEARALARDLAQPNAMVAASMGKAKVSGKIVQKVETGKPGAFDDLDDADLAAEITEGIKEFPELMEQLRGAPRGSRATKH